MSPRLPIQGGDSGLWGTLLNELWRVEHNDDGSNRNGIINVKAAPYNAAGNGTTNDTAAFTSALSAVAHGGTILVPAETYAIDPRVPGQQHLC